MCALSVGGRARFVGNLGAFSELLEQHKEGTSKLENKIKIGMKQVRTFRHTLHRVKDFKRKRGRDTRPLSTFRAKMAGA